MRWLKPVLGLVVAALVGYEAFVSPPYQDGAGVWTNGYGNTELVTKRTPPVTEPQARAKLEQRVSKDAAAVDKVLIRPATAGQTVAYVSLTYNIGIGAFTHSTVVRRHNAGDFVGACNAILMWNKITVHGKLVYSQGLANRRASEQATCLKDIR